MSKRITNNSASMIRCKMVTKVKNDDTKSIRTKSPDAHSILKNLVFEPADYQPLFCTRLGFFDITE